jgi:hypothetical protein
MSAGAETGMMSTEAMVVAGLGILGFIGNGFMFAIKMTRAFDAERLDREKALNLAVTSRSVELEKLQKEWDDSQESQNRVLGEMGHALRAAIEGIEKQMHRNELWNRDNYVRKEELASIRSDIKDLELDVRKLFEGLKTDFKTYINDLKEDLKGRH